jgi:hypothetical protein
MKDRKPVWLAPGARLVNGDTGIAAILLLGGLYWMVAAVPYGFWQGFAPSTGFLPFCYGALLAVLAAVILAERLMRPENEEAARENPRKPLTIVALVALAILGIEAAGFVPATLVLLVVLFVWVERLPLLPSAAIAVATTAGLHFLFRVWLGVPLPEGPLGV